MDLFEEEELIDDTRAKLVDYEEETAQLWERSPGCRKNIKCSMKIKESEDLGEDEYYAGKLVSRSQLSNSGETESVSGRYED